MLNRIKLCIFTTALLLASFTTQAQPERYVAGRDYSIINEPVIDDSPETIEVVEFFWYGCPGCYQFDPILENWIAQLPSNVKTTRLPAIWSDWHELHGKAYYTAKRLDRLHDIHGPLFHAMHLQGERFTSESEVQSFFEAHDVSAEDFTRTFRSFSVNSDINRAKQLARQFEARSTPSMIVNGKYLVNLSENTLDIVDFLIEKELREI